jgi:hypothetical protein
MKTFSTVAFAALALGGFVSVSVYGQDNVARSRGLFVRNFEAGKIDGMRILISKTVEGKPVAVDPSTSFKQGDAVRVSFTSNFNGYVYIVNVMPSGKKRVLFPYKTGADKRTSNMVRASQTYNYPESDDFVFDEETGTEILQVIMSREPIPYLDGAVKNPDGDLGDSASSAAAELQGKASKQGDESGKGSEGGGIVTDDVAVVLPKNGPDGVQTRDIRRVTVAAGPPRSAVLAKGKHKVDKGSVVAIPDEAGKSGKLKSGDLAVFEIRLKHV